MEFLHSTSLAQWPYALYDHFCCPESDHVTSETYQEKGFNNELVLNNSEECKIYLIKIISKIIAYNQYKTFTA